MDRQAFKQRMQNLKSYRENNPGKGYWDWKVEAFADGGVSDNFVGSYSNHTGTPTMYVPVTNLLKKYLDKMPDSDPIKKMSKQHKNIKTYTKWFNTIPLLGTATLGVNTYFNNKENKQ